MMFISISDQIPSNMKMVKEMGDLMNLPKTGWPMWGPNPRPSRYYHDSLTNWANGPVEKKSIVYMANTWY